MSLNFLMPFQDGETFFYFEMLNPQRGAVLNYFCLLWHCICIISEFHTREVEFSFFFFIRLEEPQEEHFSRLLIVQWKENLFVSSWKFLSANYYRIDNKENGRYLPNEHQIASFVGFLLLWVSLSHWVRFSFARKKQEKRSLTGVSFSWNLIWK